MLSRLHKTLMFALTLGIFIPAYSQYQWVRKSNDVFALCVTFNPQNHQTAYAGIGTPSLSSLYISHDAGEHWDTLVAVPGAIFVVAVHPLDTLMIFAGTTSGLWRTTNGGGSWSLVLDSVGFIGESIAIDPGSPNRVYVGSDMIFASQKGGFYISTDYGGTWMLSPGTDTTNYCTIALRPDSTNILYAGSDGGYISKSTDYGLTWRRVHSPGGEIPIIVIDPQNPLVAYATQNGPPSGVWKTTDGGETWIGSGLDGIHTWSLDVDPNSPRNLLTGEFHLSNPPFLGRMFQSTDAGQTWLDVSNGLPQTGIAHWSVKIVSIETPLVLAAVGGYPQGGGIYKLQNIVSVPSREWGSGVPEWYGIEQNYPNPFNPTTTIQFSIPYRSFVTLKIFDVLGQEVGTLVSQELGAGTFKTQWDATGFPSGVYFYRLQAGPFAETKRVMFLK